eukprot:5597091-Pleurochrysis_carterae.AAC.5
MQAFDSVRTPVIFVINAFPFFHTSSRLRDANLSAALRASFKFRQSRFSNSSQTRAPPFSIARAASFAHRATTMDARRREILKTESGAKRFGLPSPARSVFQNGSIKSARDPSACDSASEEQSRAHVHRVSSIQIRCNSMQRKHLRSSDGIGASQAGGDGILRWQLGEICATR